MVRSNIKAILMERLIGVYALTKVIDSPHIIANGVAYFVHNSDNCIKYYETGSYILNDEEHAFHQERLFVFNDQKMQILSHKSQLLHEIELFCLKMPSCAFENVYICNFDKYVLSFSLYERGLIMNYKVVGSSKDYSIETRLHDLP